MRQNTDKSSEAATGLVLVHPHFDPILAAGHRLTCLPPGQEELPADLKSISSRFPFLTATVREFHRLHEFYCREIDRYSEDPNIKILILRMTMDHSSRQDLGSTPPMAALRSPDVEELLKICGHLCQYQDRVIRHAQMRFGDRCMITDEDPLRIGEVAQRFFNDPAHRLEVFGEIFDCCVPDAKFALSKSGFINAVIIENKCPC